MCGRRRWAATWGWCGARWQRSSIDMNWLTLDTLLTRIRPQRERLSLLFDAVVVALAWQATYLFRLGFRNWLDERPPYDWAVLAGLVLLYALVLWLLKVPKGMWRFSGFGEIK